MKAFLEKYSVYILLALLIYVPVFGFLDTMPIRIWDESRIAANAYEMYSEGDYIVTHCNGDIEMWNTKPPLLIWCQVLLMKLIGVNEIAIRLPSAFAAFFTCLALLWLCVRYLKNTWLGFITVMVLITTQGYIHDHVTRTGEYDSMLTLFTTASCLTFYAFCETKRTGYIYAFFICLALAVLTKSVAGLLFTPALLIYSLIRRQLRSLLTDKHIYFSALIFLVMVASFYIVREYKGPGFLARIQENELGGRYFESQGGLPFDPWYYLRNFVNERLADRYFLVPLGILAGFLSKDERVKRFTGFAFLMSLSFFLVISGSKTRLEQYDAPLYPFLSFFIALSVYFVIDRIKNASWLPEKQRARLLPAIFLFLLLAVPYQKIFAKTYLPEERYFWEADFYEVDYFFKRAIKGKENLNGKFFVYDGYDMHHAFYIRILREKGVNVNSKHPSLIAVGDQLITCQESVQQVIEQKYICNRAWTKGHIVIYEIYSLKEDTSQQN